MHNIFNGLIWFVLPCCLVFCNDITAYITGMLYGRKFIRRPFLSVSPNKTWEGFIGGWFFTMIAGWYLGRFLAQFTWMTCPTNEFRFFSEKLTCQLDPIFEPAHFIFPSQIFELLPQNVVKMLFPRIVEICAIATSNANTNNVELVRCVSGEETQVHHHFEQNIKNYYPIQVHAVWLALFASLVAPFGGYLASAIKRAYGIKDFDSIIPGAYIIVYCVSWLAYKCML
jgi:phosphatidate cytidylyltransferase